MSYFGRFCLDQEKDIIVTLDLSDGVLSYVLTTPNHTTGNLITNLARACGLPVSFDGEGLKVIRGTVPCYIDGDNRKVWVFRMGNTKAANIYPDGTIERKASIPAISKTLMSQTKNCRLDFYRTIVKTYIPAECKFRTDLHTHMNANLTPDVLIALGIHHQIRYPLYYIKKLKMRVTEKQKALLEQRRKSAAKQFENSELTGKYLTRKIDDNTFINFAAFMLEDPQNAEYNIPKIRASLAVMKDGQAVFTNLEKVYLYRYVFAKGVQSEDRIVLNDIGRIPDRDIAAALRQMEEDRINPAYANNTLFQDKLLWTARGYSKKGVCYAEISDTSLVKKEAAAETLRQIHEVMPHVTEETGVVLRFLAAIRRIPLTIVRDQVSASDYLQENIRVLHAVSKDPYVAGCDIVGEEINDIRELQPLLKEIVRIAASEPSFVIRVHAGENDSLRDNVYNSIRCVRESLEEGQKMPHMRIGHGLYTANLKSAKGKQLIREILEDDVVLEFQITSNVRLNNLSVLDNHPLKQYLAAGIRCVQGTDGGALYGTDSIDEQLSLERMLDLSREEMLQMRRAEDGILQESLLAFEAKKESFRRLQNGRTAEQTLHDLINEQVSSGTLLLKTVRKYDSREVFADVIEELPENRVPVIIAGGSFNNDRHSTRLKPEGCALIDSLLKTADPAKVFFVIGHTLSGYEKHLLDENRERFEVWAFVPAAVTAKEKKRILESGVRVRVSIEPSPMGMYKSIAYEIFKHRNSVMIAFDGNSAAVNLIQEAKNGREKCRTYVFRRAAMLRSKAMSLQGYITLFEDASVLEDILKHTEEYYKKITE